MHYKKLLASPDARARGHFAYILRWLVWGVILTLLGGGLAGFKQDGGLIPLNKNMWSPSFVFLIAGIDFLLLALLYAIVDVGAFWSGAPLAYVGMNSIVVYVSSEVFGNYFPFQSSIGPSFSSHAEFLTSNVVGVLAWIAFSRYLYLHKIFVNV